VETGFDDDDGGSADVAGGTRLALVITLTYGTVGDGAA